MSLSTIHKTGKDTKCIQITKLKHKIIIYYFIYSYLIMYNIIKNQQVLARVSKKRRVYAPASFQTIKIIGQ